VLVSEIMLQQTQAGRVAPAYERFVEAFPTVRALAGASPADVLRAWGRLGYNRRALNLHRAARVIVRDHGGAVPGDPAVSSSPGSGRTARPRRPNHPSSAEWAGAPASPLIGSARHSQVRRGSGGPP
jgi:adenine-specific DNA glycosylase